MQNNNKTSCVPKLALSIFLNFGPVLFVVALSEHLCQAIYEFVFCVYEWTEFSCYKHL
jgi:hypothetical protein